MRIVIVADAFPPLRSSGAVQLRDLSLEFAKQGHDITMIVASSEINRPWVIDNYHGVTVLRIRLPAVKNLGYFSRTFIEFLMPYWMRKCFLKSPLSNKKFDAIIWYSPTIFLGSFIKLLKKRYLCHGYLIIRDIFPEWARDVGLIRSKFVYCFFDLVAKSQYKQADIIGVQTKGNLLYFETHKKKYPKTRIEVLNNWLSPAPNIGSSINISDTKLAHRIIFVYAGNMGVAQNTRIFLKLAERLIFRRDIGFLFVGRGTEREVLENAYSNLENVLFFDEISPEEIPGLYAQCHMGMISLDSRHKSHNIPGKFLTYMQGGLPVIACINSGNDLIDIIVDHQVGIVIRNDEIFEDLVINWVEKLETDPSIRDRCKLLATKMFSSENAVCQILRALHAPSP